MNILHLVGSLAPSSGGPGLIAASLASAQAQFGHEVTILCNHGAELDATIEATVGRLPGFNRVVVDNIGSPTPAETLLPLHGATRLRHRIDAATVVHLHGVWEPVLYWASKIARKRGARHVVMPHSMLNPWEMGHFTILKRFLFVLGLRRMVTSAAYVHCGTRDEARFVTALMPGCKTEVIPNGVFLEQFHNMPPPGSFHTQHPELNGEPFILFLARLNRQKGLTFLAKAFNLLAARNRSIRLVVAGPDGGAREEFLEEVGKGFAASRVHLVGPLYGEKKMEALSGATCFCQPSFNEGFSMSILEALASGVPPVISTGCFFPEVESSGAGRVVPLEPVRIAAALEEILSNEGLRMKMKDAARRMVQDGYTWPAVARRTLHAYGRPHVEKAER